MNADGRLARSLSRASAGVGDVVRIRCGERFHLHTTCMRQETMLAISWTANQEGAVSGELRCACRHREAMHLVRLLPADSARLLPSAESSEGVERCEVVTNPWAGEPALPR